MIDLSSVFLIEVKPPLAYSVGICMLISCFLMSLKARWQSQPHLGFQRGSRMACVTMLLVAVWLFIRAMTIFWTSSLNVNVILLALFFAIWRIFDLRDYYRLSKAAH